MITQRYSNENKEQRIRRIKEAARKKKTNDGEVPAKHVAVDTTTSRNSLNYTRSDQDAHDKDEWYQWNGGWYKGNNPELETQDTGRPSRETEKLHATENADEWY